ncbi:MAG: MarR family transcriptional regulator [Gemmatimonadota bacterium]|nr:MAG: MarR family transcriptional regulator [Gemmatimonadota bacterium]
MDVLRELGALAFASRLKRLSERLYRDVSKTYGLLDVEFEARWFPLLHLLSLNDELAVTEISAELGLTHPAVNQVAAAMTQRGLLESRRDPADERRRLLALTAKGRGLAAQLSPVWRVVRAETEGLLAESGADVLAALDRIEASLDRDDLAARLRRRLLEPGTNGAKIIDYRPELARAFARLNRAWLEEYFEVEEEDEGQLSDPQGRIIDAGGAIMFAEVDGAILGTVAIVPDGEGGFELTKLAVDAGARGRGVGQALTLRAIERARELGARRVILFTSPRLRGALSLYRTLGFRPVRIDEETKAKYERETVKLSLDLD